MQYEFITLFSTGHQSKCLLLKGDVDDEWERGSCADQHPPLATLLTSQLKHSKIQDTTRCQKGLKFFGLHLKFKAKVPKDISGPILDKNLDLALENNF